MQLDIFNKHSDRVKMANLAQMVNVIHSIILTEGRHMILTPTYYVFELYKGHHDASLLGSWLETEEIGDEESRIPSLSHTASIKDGELHLTVSNLSPFRSEEIDCYLLGYTPEITEGRILQGDMAAHNTFDNPENIKLNELQEIKRKDGGISFILPACSVAEIILKENSPKK